MTQPDLCGKRILVVEDEIILCMDICDQIETCGGVVIGPATTLVGGQALLENEKRPDGGILNIRIGSHMVYPLADRLIGAGVPIIFASSENRQTIPDKYADVPLISKPVNMMVVASHLFPH